jgi:hypothetical protein
MTLDISLTRPLKLHLRSHDIHGRALHIATLRPQTGVRFSTNYYHDTWHILAGSDGVALLGRLLWGLAFQRHPGTAILIDEPHLVSTPFDGDPPDPILLVPDGLTSFDDGTLRALRLRLRRCPGPPTTIRWHTFGMQRALAADRTRRRPDDPVFTRERMSRRAGFVCYTAPPALLCGHAIGVYRMHAWGEGYHPLCENSHRTCWGSDGEVQLIRGFADQVSAARVARREVLEDDARPIATEGDLRAIYSHTERAVRRLRAARARRTP